MGWTKTTPPDDRQHCPRCGQIIEERLDYRGFPEEHVCTASDEAVARRKAAEAAWIEEEYARRHPVEPSADAQRIGIIEEIRELESRLAGWVEASAEAIASNKCEECGVEGGPCWTDSKGTRYVASPWGEHQPADPPRHLRLEAEAELEALKKRLASL